jgi:hypothetical protein
LRNYIGSVAADSSGGIVAASAPKGGLVTYWDISSRRYLGVSDLNDGCGLAPTHHQANFLLTSGEGWLATADSSDKLPVGQSRESGALKPRFANFALVSNSNYDLIYRSNVGIDSVIPWTDNS